MTGDLTIGADAVLGPSPASSANAAQMSAIPSEPAAPSLPKASIASSTAPIALAVATSPATKPSEQATAPTFESQTSPAQVSRSGKRTVDQVSAVAPSAVSQSTPAQASAAVAEVAQPASAQSNGRQRVKDTPPHAPSASNRPVEQETLNKPAKKPKKPPVAAAPATPPEATEDPGRSKRNRKPTDRFSPSFHEARKSRARARSPGKLLDIAWMSESTS